MSSRKPVVHYMTFCDPKTGAPWKRKANACGQRSGTSVGSGGTTTRANATCPACLEVTARARVLVADPPWPFGDRLPGAGRGAAKHYSTLSLGEIEAFPLPELADDAVLFLWRVAAMQAEALAVCDAWGFTVKAELVWIKTTDDGKRLRIGMGRSVRNVHETCLIATRGRPKRLDASVPSVFYSRRREHSQKPERFYRRVEKLYPGPYVELFARRVRPSWECFGDELGRPHP